MRVKRLAQEHNTMTRPGLDPGPFDPDYSALITRPPRLPILYALSEMCLQLTQYHRLVASSLSGSYAMLKSPRKADVTCHGCYCPCDMVMRMCKILLIVCHSLFVCHSLT